MLRWEHVFLDPIHGQGALYLPWTKSGHEAHVPLLNGFLGFLLVTWKRRLGNPFRGWVFPNLTYNKYGLVLRGALVFLG